jgi:hypothetical protein
MRRLTIVARLKSGANADAERLIAEGPPFAPDDLGFERHFVFLTATEAVFLFEGPSVEWVVDDLVSDPVASAAFAPWRPLLDGPPRLAREVFAWTHEAFDQRERQESG